LDAGTGEFVFKLLKRRKDLGTLITLHHKDLVQKADIVYELNNSRVMPVENNDLFDFVEFSISICTEASIEKS